MLSRHFYRLDEVHVALPFAIIRKRHTEAAFWCQELIDTLDIPALWNTLLHTWIWHFLTTNPTWLYRYYKPTSVDPLVLHKACYSLGISVKDNRLWWQLVERIKSQTQNQNQSDSSEDVDQFRQALQNQSDAAWNLIITNRVSMATAKKELPPSILYSHLEEPAAICASILLITTPRIEKKALTPLPTEIQTDLLTWAFNKGRRSRREYSIPTECLYGLAGRGRLAQSASTLPELRSIDATLHTTPGPFWALFMPLDNDDKLEEFYQTYFPDDIPEEWFQVAHQLVSHGNGILRTSEVDSGLFSFARLSRIWFSGSEWPVSLSPLTSSVEFKDILSYV